MSKRRHVPEGAVGVQLSLIITPMLDMSFQILAFFIMTYHPSALEGHIAGSLAAPQDAGIQNRHPLDDVAVLQDNLAVDAMTVTVKTNGDGKVSKVLLRRR